jgi:hypothetical protein
MAASISDVRLPSDNGHQRDVPARPFRANKRHSFNSEEGLQMAGIAPPEAGSDSGRHQA